MNENAASPFGAARGQDVENRGDARKESYREAPAALPFVSLAEGDVLPSAADGDPAPPYARVIAIGDRGPDEADGFSGPFVPAVFFLVEDRGVSKTLQREALGNEPLLFVFPSEGKCGAGCEFVASKNDAKSRCELEPLARPGPTGARVSDIGFPASKVVPFESESAMDRKHEGAGAENVGGDEFGFELDGFFALFRLPGTLRLLGGSQKAKKGGENGRPGMW